MHINKYILGLATLSVIGGLGWLSVEALSISNSSFDKGAPVFKSIFLRSEGKDTINGSTNPEKIRLDNNGLYISPGALPGSLSNVLKLRADGYIQIDPVRNGDITDNAITSTHIKNLTITNTNFSDLTIVARHLSNSSIVKSKFDPAISFPTGQVFLTNNVCVGGTAITSVNAGTATCSPFASGSTTLPACNEGEVPVYSGGVWGCEVLLLGGSGGTDPYWANDSIGAQRITNLNAGNVGIGTTTPSRKLSVQGTTKFLGETEEQVYCYATDTWVPIGTYNAAVCAGCSPGYSYNPGTLLCEQNSCVGSGTDGICGSDNGGSFPDVSPPTNLCSTGNASVVTQTGAPSHLWLWSCNGTNGGANASCSAFVLGTGGSGGGSNDIFIWNRSNPGDLINGITVNGAQFIAVNNGTFPIGGGSSLDGVHGDMMANDMDYDISSPGMQCLYVFVNNEADATLGGCNPSGYVSQTQVPAATSNGTIFAPAYSSSDRIDIVMCGGICN